MLAGTILALELSHLLKRLLPYWKIMYSCGGNNGETFLQNSTHYNFLYYFFQLGRLERSWSLPTMKEPVTNLERQVASCGTRWYIHNWQKIGKGSTRTLPIFVTTLYSALHPSSHSHTVHAYPSTLTLSNHTPMPHPLSSPHSSRSTCAAVGIDSCKDSFKG